MFNTLEKIFTKFKVITINDLRSLLEEDKINQRAGRTSFRVFLNYLEENELISDLDLIRARKKIKIVTSNNIDKYVPRTKEIKQTLVILNSYEFPKEILVMYKFMLESGCRFTELEYLMKNFDKNNIDADMIKQSDHALYIAKKEGRNRVVL